MKEMVKDKAEEAANLSMQDVMEVVNELHLDPATAIIQVPSSHEQNEAKNKVKRKHRVIRVADDFTVCRSNLYIKFYAQNVAKIFDEKCIIFVPNFRYLAPVVMLRRVNSWSKRPLEAIVLQRGRW